MLQFWRNPEFVRHLRAELRPRRALTAAALVLVVCMLVGLSCWTAEHDDLVKFFYLYHVWLLGIQFVVLCFWCASACGQAISRERDLKTYDFLRTTRLTAAELMVGKLLGVPITAYFVVICSLPVALIAGVAGGIAPSTLLGAYLVMLVCALFIGLASLWLSMLVEKTGGGAIGLLWLLLIGLSVGWVESPFPGFGGISVMPVLFALYRVDADIARRLPTMFGAEVPFLVITVFLYAAFGVWFVLMITRNLKRDREQIRLLSRWQAIGFVAFLNVLYYAFLDPGSLTGVSRVGHLRPSGLSTFAAGLNAGILFLVGVATLTPHERLKVWWRRVSAGAGSYLAPDGLAWPWLVAGAAIAYVLLVAEALGLRSAIPLSRWRLGVAAVQMLVCLVFVIRDVLFLQWCNLTRMKQPVAKGILYLLLYYSAAGILALAAGTLWESADRFMVGLLTPFRALDLSTLALGDATDVYLAVPLQVGAVLLLLAAINHRLGRPAKSPVAGQF